MPSHHCAILVHSWPLTSAKMSLLFTRPKSLIWSFFSLKLRYPALYSIYSSGAGFIAACNHNYTLFLFNCQLRILWCHSPYATTELLDELKVSAPLFLLGVDFPVNSSIITVQSRHRKAVSLRIQLTFCKATFGFRTSAEIPY